jgi:DNA-binding response OmpR family regulator/anti-sigma regulatory factor (Ser/Thr protein kinase)
MRGIELNVSSEEEAIGVYCDRDLVEKILTNLLSNAFKFTPEGGRVTVNVTRSGRPSSDSADPVSVEISVADTGIGIPPDQLEKVFDRFYQIDSSQTREQEGSGIGLALVKELVDLHHGTIRVQSSVGEGTKFTVQFPTGAGALSADDLVEGPPGAEASRPKLVPLGVNRSTAREVDEPLAGDPGDGKPIALIIEDNADVRAYIRDCLETAYQVIEARDGVEGIASAQEAIPDLIISDVMMPKKDGYEVCKVLKLDERTSHIPIILLTAKAAVENRLDGLAVGADDYLIKPFEPRELLARARNLIELRRKLRARFSATVPLKPGEIAVSSIDDVFLKKVTAAVEGRMGDENFSVEDLGREVAMSRSQVHRKLKALTNQSASDFIRYMRLLRGMELLRGNAGTVAEVAYSVGFRDPSYFSKWFHRQFGMSPSDIRKDSQARPA